MDGAAAEPIPLFISSYWNVCLFALSPINQVLACHYGALSNEPFPLMNISAKGIDSQKLRERMKGGENALKEQQHLQHLLTVTIG